MPGRRIGQEEGPDRVHTRAHAIRRSRTPMIIVVLLHCSCWVERRSGIQRVGRVRGVIRSTKVQVAGRSAPIRSHGVTIGLSLSLDSTC